jgi:hypothetical protein
MSPSCEPCQSPYISSLLVVASPWATNGDVALPGKKSSFFFSRDRMLGVMLSQKQFHKSCQGSYEPFVSSAKVEGRVDVGKIWLEKVRASF